MVFWAPNRWKTMFKGLVHEIVIKVENSNEVVEAKDLQKKKIYIYHKYL